MKVYFNFAYPARPKYRSRHDFIIDTLRKRHVEVLSLELVSYVDLLGKDVVKKYTENGGRTGVDGRLHYQYIKKGLSVANAAILEVSKASREKDPDEGNFRLGHEATLSLLFNKPVLCVSDSTDYSDYISHPLFYARKYSSEKELAQILDEFIDEYKRKYLHIRFNGYISPEQKNFLDWFGKRTGRNASEIVRDLIDEKIKENPEFKESMLDDLPSSL